MDVIPIPPPLFDAANSMASSRYVINRQLDTQNDKKYGDPHTKELYGILGELVFAWYLGVWPANCFGTHPDNGADFVIRGWRIDVKTTASPNVDLSARVDKRMGTVDMFVLVRIVSPKVCRLEGWAWANDLQRKENIQQLSYSLSYCLAKRDLQPMVELRRVLSEKKPCNSQAK